MPDRWEPVPIPKGDGRHDIGDDARAAIFHRLHDDFTLAAPWLTAEQRKHLAMLAAASVRALLHELGTLRDMQAPLLSDEAQSACSTPPEDQPGKSSLQSELEEARKLLEVAGADSQGERRARQRALVTLPAPATTQTADFKTLQEAETFLLAEHFSRRAEKAEAELEEARQQRDEATGCDGNCSCAIGSRHFWHRAFCQERDRVAALTKERDELKRQVSGGTEG